MNNIISFINKYKYPLLILVIYIIYTILTWGKWGDFVYDSYREAILPQAVLEGKIIYKDITCMYPPLVYYFHALLYYIFGQSLNVLYFVGIFLTLSVLSFVYYILKIKSSDVTAFVTVFSIMCALTFRISQWHAVSSWYLPYSYAVLYSLFFIVVSFVFLVLFNDKNKVKYLYLSFLLCGISAAFKLDFVIFIFLPVYYAVKTKKISNILAGLVLFIIPLLISFLLYFATGGTYTDLQNEYKLLMNFCNSPFVKAYNDSFIPTSFNPEVLRNIKSSFILFFKMISFYIFICTVFQFLLSKSKHLFAKYSLIILEITSIFIVLLFTFKMQGEAYLHSNLIFITYLDIIFLLIILIVKRFNIINCEKEKFFVLLFITGILISNRCIVAPYTDNVGNFNIIFLFIAFIYFCIEILPQYINFINKVYVKNVIICSLISYFLSYTFYYYDVSKSLDGEIYEKGKGVVYIDWQYYYQYAQISDYINNNTSIDDSVLLVPEYLVVNYFTGRKIFNYKYYNLILHVLEMYGENNVLEEIKSNPPDYYVWTNNLYAYNIENWFTFGSEYAQNIHQYFAENYDIVHEIYSDDGSNDIFAVIYKRRD